MPINWKSPRASYILLDVDGTQFDFFRDYHVSIDLLSPGGQFDFAASLIPGKRGVRESLGPKGLAYGRKVALRLVTQYGTTLQHTGRIYDVDYELTRKNGSLIHVVVRDHMHPLVHADAVPAMSMDGATLSDVFIRTIALFGFSAKDVTIDTDAARNLMTGRPAAGVTLSSQAPINLEDYKVDQALPNAGENAFTFLSRHARRFGLLIWGTADGRIVLGRPNYSQKARYTFLAKGGFKGVANNVKSIRRRLSMSQRPSEVHVYGKTFGGDFSRSAIHEVVYDDEIRGIVYMPVTMQDHNARDATQARERGQYEIGKRRQTADVVTVQLARHCAPDGTVYAIDTIGDVQFDAAQVDAGMYVVRRTFTASQSAGTETTLDLVRKNSIVLGEGVR